VIAQTACISAAGGFSAADCHSICVISFMTSWDFCKLHIMRLVHLFLSFLFFILAVFLSELGMDFTPKLTYIPVSSSMTEPNLRKILSSSDIILPRCIRPT